MTILSANFRNALFAGIAVVAALGVYLLQLWQPDRQVQLHSEHLLRAFERNDVAALAKFLHESYSDQWKQNREQALMRLGELRRVTQNIALETNDVLVFAAGDTGEWRARITATADRPELNMLFNERLNNVPEPFRLEWRRSSWKPWDWRLVHVSNPALQLSEAMTLF